MAQDPLGIVVKESVQELYYLAFLYLGHFLRDLFLTLSLVVRPKPALTPILIAKYHLSFYDAIGRPPRILDYDCFASYKVFQAFLEDSFAGRPGASWIDLGLYQLANARNGLAMSGDTWSSMISPGSHINMSMLVDQTPAYEVVLQKTAGSVWMQCSHCKIEVLISKNRKSLPSSSKPDQNQVEQYPEMIDLADEEVPEANNGGGAKIGATLPTRIVKDALVDDIIHFKRVLRHPQPPKTFLFAVNELPVNEDPENGGLAARFNDNRRWIPPVYKIGFGPQTLGPLYRWTDGTITAADDFHFDDGVWLERGTSNPLTLYGAASMFWCNHWVEFLVTSGDVSTRNMAGEEFSGARGRWWPLTFRHNKSLSRIELAGDEIILAGSSAPWINRLGLRSYTNRRNNTRAQGLAGSIPMIIALIAFSCQCQDLEKILLVDRAWHFNKWRHHGRPDGRLDARGFVVNVYLDPENPEGSTQDTIFQLEWGDGPLLG